MSSAPATNIFGLQVGSSATSAFAGLGGLGLGDLGLGDPSTAALLGNGMYATQLLAGPANLGFKLAGLPGQIGGDLLLRDGTAGGGLDAYMLLGGQQYGGQDLGVQALAQLQALHSNAAAMQVLAQPAGRPGSPQEGLGGGVQQALGHHGQQPLSSSPPPTGMTSQGSHPSHPDHNGHGVDGDDDGLDELGQRGGSRVRRDASAAWLGAGNGGVGNGHAGGSLAGAALSLPPSMASLAAVMGPGGTSNQLLVSHPDGSVQLLDAARTQQFLLLQQQQQQQLALQQQALQQLQAQQAGLGGLQITMGLEELQRAALQQAGLSVGTVGLVSALESLQGQQVAMAPAGLLPAAQMQGQAGTGLPSCSWQAGSLVSGAAPFGLLAYNVQMPYSLGEDDALRRG